MNPALLVILAIAWLAPIGATLYAYLENKLAKWSIGIVILFGIAIVATLVAVMAGGQSTATMN